MVPAFFGMTALACVERFLKLREAIEKYFGIKASYLTAIYVALWAVVTFLLARFMFLVAATAGELKAKLGEQEKRAGELLSAHEKAAAQQIAQVEGERQRLLDAFSCVHAVIHRTRDTLLSNCAFARLTGMNDGGANSFL